MCFEMTQGFACGKAAVALTAWQQFGYKITIGHAFEPFAKMMKRAFHHRPMVWRGDFFPGHVVEAEGDRRAGSLRQQFGQELEFLRR